MSSGGWLLVDRVNGFNSWQLHADSIPTGASHPAEIMVEQTKKQRNVPKEHNRDLISSQHVQVKRSWENPGVYIWGSNTGKVAAPDSNDSYIKNPRRLHFFDGQVLRDLKLDENHAAAICASGDLYQWGSAYSPEIQAPDRTLIGKNLVSLALSKDRIIALSANGTVYSVAARRQEQQSGPKSRESSWMQFWSSAPQISYRTIRPNLATFERVTAVASGLEHCLMLTSSGRVFSAVSSSSSFPSRGQLGIPGLTGQNHWGKGLHDMGGELSTLSGFKIQSVAAGDFHSLVLDTEGRVFAFGDNSFGQLGQDFNAEVAAIDAPSLLPISRLYAGSGHSPKVTAIAAGGSNSYFLVDAKRTAQPGDASPASLRSPIGRISADVWSCGRGSFGQLGNGRWTHIQGNPVKIKSLSGLFEYDEITGQLVPIRVGQLTVGATHVAAVLANITYLDAHAGTSEDDTNWGADVMWWGGNEHWQLGTGKRNNCATPVYIGPLGASDIREKRGEHRLHITPRKNVKLEDRWIWMEQRVECGRFVSAVYSG